MKAKLLKKVRKRFVITHYPNGISSSNHYNKLNTFELMDKKQSPNMFYCCDHAVLITKEIKDPFRILQREVPSNYFLTEKECIEYLCKLIILQLRKDGYPSKRYDGKVVWYQR